MLNRLFSAAGRRQPTRPETVDGVPILSAGSHRDASEGACFMEYASYLAGEPWSDHPTCTHPLLAHLAREVNDWMSDAGRHTLTPLIPTVIGMTCDDPMAYPLLVARVVRTALPRVAHQDQLVLAVALIRAEQVVAELEGRPRTSRSEASRQVLEETTPASRWAESFLKLRPLPRLVTYFRRAAPNSITAAIHAAVRSVHTDPDQLLRQLLTEGIDAISTLATTPEHQDAKRTAPAPAHTS